MKITDFKSALEYLGNKTDRPFAHNTRIKINENGVPCAAYHGNVVTIFHPDCTWYSSAGWKTMTTKERINWFLPEGFYVYQEKSVWYLSDREAQEHYPFQDGIKIFMPSRIVTDYGSISAEQGTKKKIKEIKKYVEGWINELISGKMDEPSGGDCWSCLMNIPSADHIQLHMEENYYVPSLIMRAIEYRDISSMARDGIARLWAKVEVSDWQKSIIIRDVKSSLTSYIKHNLGIAQ